MAKRSRSARQRSAHPEDGPVDDTASLGKIAGDQAASGLPQGLVWPFFIYAVARATGALGRFLRGGRRLR